MKKRPSTNCWYLCSPEPLVDWTTPACGGRSEQHSSPSVLSSQSGARPAGGHMGRDRKQHTRERWCRTDRDGIITGMASCMFDAAQGRGGYARAAHCVQSTKHALVACHSPTGSTANAKSYHVLSCWTHPRGVCEIAMQRETPILCTTAYQPSFLACARLTRVIIRQFGPSFDTKNTSPPGVVRT